MEVNRPSIKDLIVSFSDLSQSFTAVLANGRSVTKMGRLKGGHWQLDSIKRWVTDTIWNGVGHVYHQGDYRLWFLQEFRECSPPESYHMLLFFRTPIGDYLSMPLDAGIFHIIGIYLDLYSWYVCGFKFKIAGTAKTTIGSLRTMFMNYFLAECFMCDGSSHFKNKAVRESCEIFGEDEYNTMTPENLPKMWPKHFDEAIQILNCRLLAVFSSQGTAAWNGG